jgi:excisionase family DNA binding protein
MDQDATVPRLAFSLDEVARSSGLSRRMLYKLIDTGELQTVKRGCRRLVPRDALERLCCGAECTAAVPNSSTMNSGRSTSPIANVSVTAGRIRPPHVPDIIPCRITR